MAYEHAAARYKRWYAKLLRFYPQPYRERFAEGMQQTFNDLCRERYNAGGGLSGFVFWMFTDTVAGIIKENIKKENIIMIQILKSFGGLIISLIATIAIIVSTYLSKNLDAMWIILIVLFVVLAIWEQWIKNKL
jgi:CDP-diglyceride synthetase